jgi:N-acetylglucosamine malate deacetylase 1
MEEVMDKLNRRSMLGKSALLTGATTLLPEGESGAQEKPSGAKRKLKVVAVGGHFDDPQTACGGTLALYADLGHEIIALSLTGGPAPAPEKSSEDRQVKNRRNAIKMSEILRIQLICLNYSGSNSGADGRPIVYGTGAEVTAQRYKEFTEALLDHKPDIVFTHWPIDFHPDHRAASLLTYSAWLSGGRSFPLYYYECELGKQTQDFSPTHYVDITPVADRKHEAFKADTLWYDYAWPMHEAMQKLRGMEHGCKAAEAFNHHPQSPTEPALP